jgi:multicomponent Na+:H+ antiporter subunit F
MTGWLIAAAVLGAGLIPCLIICVVQDPAHGLVASEIAGVLITTILMILAEAFQRQPFIDLAVTMAFLSLVGSLVLARLIERDL